MGPPWQADWTKGAEGNRDALPDDARGLVAAALYFRGIDTDLPAGMSVEPTQSTRPGRQHVLYFDHGGGWLRYQFPRRTTDPQIVIDECFWQ